MKFQEITDSQWETIQNHLPPHAKTGRPRADDRMTLNGILFVAITGCRWSEMPKRYDDDSTANLRLRSWLAANWGMEKGSIGANQDCPQAKQSQPAKNISWLDNCTCQKRGNIVGFDGFKRISGTKIHIAVESNGLPISIVIGPANQHDSTRFVDIMESIPDFLDENTVEGIRQCYADKGHDAEFIRNYLEKRKILDCIPYRKNSKAEHDASEQHVYGKTRYVVERFFAWLKNGFRRTMIRYEKNAENYLAFVSLASFLMYCRVLRWVACLSVISWNFICYRQHYR